ncbi:MAG: metal ABC transporter substrate-binding protein [Reinekea forsetii]|nr:metal ABC transporter substrate-binding protein [Reinekea forsetii]MDO7674833.1 metal ABC transporter substrate-binding protein [Reinekea forsetii]
MHSSISASSRRKSFILLLMGLTLPLFSVAADKIKVVATFSVLADMVEQIAGDAIELTTLVGLNSDAHVYQIRPIDAKHVSEADLLVTNGLGFEGWLGRLEQSSGFKGRKLVASDGIEAIHHEGHADHADHGDGDLDPHAWHSLSNGRQYVSNIAQALIDVDPAHADHYQRNLVRYLAEIDALDLELSGRVAAIPEGQRRVITSHDAFAYLAQAYGFEFFSPQRISTEAQPSARDIAQLIRQIREQGIGALFIENISDDRLMQQIASETDVKLGGKLYSGALSGANEPASTYLAMMRHNVTLLLAAF